MIKTDDNKEMELVNIYKAMADENRLRILSVLTEGAFNVQELTSVLKGTQSNISHHLKTLQNAGLVGCRREGTWAYYFIEQFEEPTPSAKVIKSFHESAHTNGSSELYALDRQRAHTLLEKRRDEAKQFFESVAPRWSELRDETIDSNQYLKSVAALVPDEGILAELGCGSGALLAKLLPRKGTTIGVDYSPAMLDAAKSTLKAFDVDLRLGYLEHLPLTDQSVQTALCHMVLHHMTKPEEALRDAARILVSGGKLIVVDLNAHQNEQMRDRYADLWLGFESKQFQRWIKACGLKIESVANLGTKNEVFLLVAVKP